MDEELWEKWMEVIMDEDATDDILDDIVYEILTASEAPQQQEMPMKADGSERRKVRRVDYSRRAKFQKMEDDPTTHLQWMQWINDPRVAVIIYHLKVIVKF